MERTKIREHIGFEYVKNNIENEEFSYQQALSKIGKNYEDYLVEDVETKHKNLDLRFANDKLSILVETKNNIKKLSKKEYQKAIKQLQSYLNMERALTDNEIICILSSTQNSEIEVYYGKNFNITDEFKKEDKVIKTFEDYEDLYFGTKNDKIKIVENTYELNELLHSYGIKEELRSQFVGTCLLALKNRLIYSYLKEETNSLEEITRKEIMTNSQIIKGIEDILEKLLNKNLNKAEKLVILKNRILESQDIKDLEINEFKRVLEFIEKKILPYINDKNTEGQDILNLFFTTFNKYVGKKDKNQAFTPDHIVKFMCYLTELNKDSIVLDPCCGSGSFLVRALTTILDLCETEEEKNKVKSDQIYGVEYEENAFGLATTNMLIHGDGNSNIIKKNIFDTSPCIKKENDVCVKYDNTYYDKKSINVVLMNPPFNAQKKHCHKEFTETWNSKTTTDPSKGLHFVSYVADRVNKGLLAVILPTACAIGGSSIIDDFKSKLLEKHTLKAVFSLPNDIFNPGASVSVCCMLFQLGRPHIQNGVNGKIHNKTFFGYYKDDGFTKKKKLGRVEKFVDGKSLWEEIYKEWIDLYNNKIEKTGKSVLKEVMADDEWLPEAYMETDYSKLKEEYFEKSIKNFLAYKIKYGDYIEYK